MKTEPVCAINEKPKNPCTRCGLEFFQNYLSLCKAKTEKCGTAEELAISHVCANNQKLPTLGDEPEKHLLAE